MSSILKTTYWDTADKLSEYGCANKQLEEVLYLWFITNGPASKGGDIPGDVISEKELQRMLKIPDLK